MPVRDRPVWTPVGGPARREPLVHQEIAARAIVRPGAPALVFGEEAVSYAALDRRANQLAHHLRAAGVRPGGLVAVHLPRCPDHYITLLAVLRAGGCYLPLDPAYPPDRLRYMLADAKPRVLVTQSAMPTDLTAGSSTAAEHTVVRVDADADHIAAWPTAPPPDVSTPEDPAYLIYTSASTGTPKGALVTHGGLANLAHWQRKACALEPEDRGALLAPLSFDGAALELWPLLVAGGTGVVVPEAVRTDPPRLVRLLREQRIAFAFLTTTLGQILLAQPDIEALPLRYLLLGGEALRQRPRPGLPFTVVNIYGPTETSMYVTCAAIAPAGEHDEPIPIGWPVGGVTVTIRDEALRELPAGEVGELCVGGAAVGAGYLDRPELTAARFVTDPAGTGRLYRTGDQARRRADGAFEFLGRRDRQVKLRGHRIELDEVETALSGHPAVARAVAVVREPTPDTQQLVGYLLPVATPGDPELAAEITAWLAERVPAYLVPDLFVVLDELPVTPIGKVDLAALPAPPVRGAGPDTARPCGATEETVADIVAELLGLAEVDVTANLAALGAHSITLALLTTRISATFGVSLSLRELFIDPRVRSIAARIDQAVIDEVLGEVEVAEAVDSIDAIDAIDAAVGEEIADGR